MSIDDKVMRHYGRDRLEEQIVEAVRAAGKDPDRLIASDLSPVDEFHLGWHEQTLAFAKELSFGPGMLILDVGCGIGGPARSFAEFSGCRVAGIDLTPDFITVADALTRRCRLDDRVSFRQASALDLPFDDATFDGAIQFHVGMNISDKAAAFAEVRRVLKPGAAFGLYDIVRTGSGELPFPLPWAVSGGDELRRAPRHLSAPPGGSRLPHRRRAQPSRLLPRPRPRAPRRDRDARPAPPRPARDHRPRGTGADRQRLARPRRGADRPGRDYRARTGLRRGGAQAGSSTAMCISRPSTRKAAAIDPNRES